MEAQSTQTQDKIDQIASADIVLGILAQIDSEAMAALAEALRHISGSPRIVALQNDHKQNPGKENLAAPEAAAGENSGSGGSLVFAPSPMMEQDDPTSPALNVQVAYQSVFKAAEKLNARACAVLASRLENWETRWFSDLVEALLQNDLDLVVPRYARRKFDGLMNSGIICPLMRSLYGKRMLNPMGPDLGVSRKLFQKMLVTERSPSGGLHPLASLGPKAFCDNLKICEVHVGARVYPQTDWTTVSSLMAQVLGPVFLDMERNAACWQRIRGSAPVPSIGEPVLLPQDDGKIDVSRLIESFELGNRELQEIWSLVLPPTSVLELRRIARLPPEQFHLPDELWVRVVYDFALAHRLRTISRDHLLKSMTPLYLAWVASYVREMQNAPRTASEQRIERLSLAFESSKPYLVSRWRWPDRFSP